MKLTSNIKEFSKQFEEYKKEVERKLKGMVYAFASNVAIKAVIETPYGSSALYPALYNNPARSISPYNLSPEEGHAKGGWIVNLIQPDYSDYGNRAETKAANDTVDAIEATLAEYKLGDSIYIQNNIPYVASTGFTNPYQGSLENGYSPQAPSGISAPTLDAVFAVYQLDLKEYYNES